MTLQRKLEFLPGLALFWFIADSPGDAAEWGFTVDVTDVVRITLTSLMFGAYFALWFYRRDQLRHCGWGAQASRHGGVAGTFTSVLGLSTGPCNVVGCGAPVMPVVGLALTGLFSETLRWFTWLSRVGTAVIPFVLVLGVACFGWLVGGEPTEESLPAVG